MAESYKNSHALSTDGRSITSAEDRKGRIRKMIEVTQSTRYTEIVERSIDDNDDDGGAMDQNSSSEVQRQQMAKQFSTSFTLMDSGLGRLATARDNKQMFTAACHEEADSYLQRVQKIEANLEETNNAAKNRHQQLEEESANEKETIRGNLLGILEVTRKKREQRDMMLKRLLEM